MNKLVDVIIPTWNNGPFLHPCVRSIIQTGFLENFGKIILINNGSEPLDKIYAKYDKILVVSEKDGLGNNINLGWERGLALGLKYSDTPYVVFMNDDTHIPPNGKLFFHNLLAPFGSQHVGIVSPVTTTASGPQSIFHPSTPSRAQEVFWLIFFCVMVNRKWLDEAGGIDTSLPGGDDLDLSIRMRKLGKALVINPDAFLIHHGFKSGVRLRGDGYAGVPNGWNSREMIEDTAHALIRKHGFKEYIMTLQGIGGYKSADMPDHEGNWIVSTVNGHKSILELGCGATKTVKESVGVDIIPKGNFIPTIRAESVADVQHDVTQPLPFEENSQDMIIARHILEHCLDLVGTLQNWKKVLKKGGQLVIATPDEDKVRGIPLDPTHVHAFTKESLKNLMESNGFKTEKLEDSGNYISMVGVFTRTS